ncbi:protein quiver-like [Mya arenaria]|uniref:protein quiver-like n=1 Tax=Mya arenaria TaxID=6604 RepID=UPI0022E313E6|nr:protein quiver-like [Mya arenaria]
MENTGILCFGVILVICAGTTHGIDCYTCNSLMEPNCEDDFNHAGITVESSCAQCMKSKGKVRDNQVVMRTCSMMALGNDGDCHEESRDGAEKNVCFCNSDNCNGTPHMRIALATVVTTVLIAFRVL